MRPESFERAGLLVDVIDAKTNKLVYRNIFAGDITRGVSDAARSQRIELLGIFFLGKVFGGGVMGR